MKIPIKQAVILAGGLGTRLRPLTLRTPKPMLLINGKPFLAYIIERLVENGISDILILIGYRGDQIKAYFRDGEKFNVRITYSDAGNNAGTGLRLKRAFHLLDDEFLLLYGDNFWPLHLEKLYKHYQKNKREALVTIYSNYDHYTVNNMLVNAHSRVTRYDKTRTKKTGLNGVDIGFFIMRKKHVSVLPEQDSMLEQTLIPYLISRKELTGYLTHHKYYGLSTIDRIPDLERYFQFKKVIFLDRDGVINEKPPKARYVTSWEEFVVPDKSLMALKMLTRKKYQIYIVTNQAGIARGIVSRRTVDSLHKRMKKEFERKGIVIHDIYVCPHGWDEGCYCRKPNPGMFLQAASDHAFDLNTAVCIGDDPRDIAAAKNAGCKKAYLVHSSNAFYDIVRSLP